MFCFLFHIHLWFKVHLVHLMPTSKKKKKMQKFLDLHLEQNKNMYVRLNITILETLNNMKSFTKTKRKRKKKLKGNMSPNLK